MDVKLGQPLDWHVARIDAVGAIEPEIILHIGGEATHTHGRQNAGDAAAHVSEFQPGDVLTLAGVAVGKAIGPSHALVIGEPKALLGPGYDVVAVIGIDPNFADRVVLWVVAWRL